MYEPCVVLQTESYALFCPTYVDVLDVVGLGVVLDVGCAVEDGVDQ